MATIVIVESIDQKSLILDTNLRIEASTSKNEQTLQIPKCDNS